MELRLGAVAPLDPVVRAMAHNHLREAVGVASVTHGHDHPLTRRAKALLASAEQALPLANCQTKPEPSQ